MIPDFRPQCVRDKDREGCRTGELTTYGTYRGHSAATTAAKKERDPEVTDHHGFHLCDIL